MTVRRARLGAEFGVRRAMVAATAVFGSSGGLLAQAESLVRTGCVEGQRATSFGCVRAEEVRFTGDGATLAGEWYTPLRGDGGNGRPAVVLVHGAGAMDRRGPGDYLTETAGYFVSRGFAVLSYDKRGTGGSSGDWRAMSFEDLAADVAAAVRYVRSRDDADPRRVGLWGISQAGWVLPLAARRTSPAFVIAVSAAGTGVTPAEQNLYDILNQARLAGLDRDRQDAVLSSWRALYALVRSDRDPGAEADYRRARDGAAAIPGAGSVLPPPLGRIRWEPRDQWFLALDIDFDAVPAWAALSVPILAIYGGADVSTPTARVVSRFRLDVVRSRTNASIEVIEEGNHVLMDGRPGSGRLLDAYTSVMDAWLDTLPF